MGFDSGSLSFDRIAAQYDATRGYPPGVSLQIAQGLMRVGTFAAGDEILEVGIGTGRIALPLLMEGVNVTGVDISPAMVERMNEKLALFQPVESEAVCGKLTVHIADMKILPFPAGSFAAVIGVHIFHLVPEWQSAVREALRVVQPGGALLIGQDMRDVESLNRIYNQWEGIVAALGFQVDNVGAAGYRAIVDELQRQGLLVEETILTSWVASSLPRLVLASVVRREWSKTWRVPDDVFAESARRLTSWATKIYGDALDRPQAGTYSFKVAIARSHASGEF